MVIESGIENINWNATGAERIRQNVKNLINTNRYDVAFMRLMGMDAALVDMPLGIIKGKIISNIYDLVKNYEPRAKITSADVYFEGGELKYKVVFDI